MSDDFANISADFEMLSVTEPSLKMDSPVISQEINGQCSAHRGYDDIISVRNYGNIDFSIKKTLFDSDDDDLCSSEICATPQKDHDIGARPLFLDEGSRDSGLGQDDDDLAVTISSRFDISRESFSFSPERDSPLKAQITDQCFPGRFAALFNEPIFSEAVPSPEDISTVSADHHVKNRASPERHDDTRMANKRPSPDRDCDHFPMPKRRREMNKPRHALETFPKPKLSLPRCQSESAADIKTVLDRVVEDLDLISDGSGSFCLPTIPGKHQDLKSITPETLANVVTNEYDHIIEQFVIVDCRYPYEYEGGHIEGAKNYYTRDRIVDNLVNKPLRTEGREKRTVLIFHCEFSSERGPKMSRFLRNIDRDCNKDNYPELFYPEVYLLHGGYKNFFHTKKELCSPQTYMPMHHDDYTEDMRKFRVKSKTWGGEKKSRSVSRLF